LENPAAEIEKILTFIGVKVSRPEMLEGLKSLLPALYEDLHLSADDVENVVLPPDNLQRVTGRQIPEELKLVGMATLEAEMKRSNGLTKWPCDSFREIDAKLLAASLPVHLPMTAQMLAANCSDPFVTCSVPIDIAGG
jgi:hypothetical protein